MRGTYVFKQAGKIVGTSSNLITGAGRREILRFLANQRGTIGGAIGVGVGDQAPDLTDSDLVLEYERIMVEVSSPDFNRSLIIYKTTLPKELEGSIYEVGLWSNPTSLTRSSNVLSFDQGFEAWSGGSWLSAGTRLGGDGLVLAPATGGTVSSTLNFTGNLADVAFNDTFALAFYSADQNTDWARVRFLNADGTSYFEYQFTEPVFGYNIVKFTKADFTKTGTLNWSDVVSAQVSVRANTTDAVIDPEIGEPLGYTGTRVTFDRLIVKPFTSEDVGNVLVSRSVRGAAIVKTPVAPMEIEYYLELTG